VATPWYPTADKPYGGAFVREWVRALDRPADQVTVVHLEMVAPGDSRGPEVRAEAEGTVHWLPVPVGDNLPRADAARAQLDVLSGVGGAAARAALTAAPVVFAHVTMPTGWAVAQVLGESQRLILAEHASYVPQLLAHPQARPLFAAAVARAAAVLTAGEQTAGLIRTALPGERAKVWAVGNPLDEAAFPFVDRPPLPDGALDHWVYVGNLFASKGVLELVRAFAAHAKGGHPAARLTVVGSGAAQAAMRSLAAEADLSGQVEFLGPQDRAGVVAALAAANLHVHLSPGETFGLAPLEALLTGLPSLTVSSAGTAQTMGVAVAAGRALLVPTWTGRRAGARYAAAAEALAWSVAAAPAGAALAVREALAARYGRAAFGAMEARVAAGQDPYPAPAAGAATAAGEPLVLVALSPGEADNLAGDLREALWQGRPVWLASPDRPILAAADPRVQTIALTVPGRAAQAARQLDRVVYLASAGPLKAAALVFKALGRLPGPTRALAAKAAQPCRAALTRVNGRHRALVQPRLRRLGLTPAARRAIAHQLETALPFPHERSIP
jgi:glycosyltransferase involved in cell wall biosynthesis